MTPQAEILWDLFEHNWSFELLVLDRIIHAEDWANEEWGSERDAAIRKVFFGNSFLVGPMPTRNQGLAAEDVQDWHPYLRAFRTVMRSWPNALGTWDDVGLAGDGEFLLSDLFQSHWQVSRYAASHPRNAAS
jgi:hypothetical protein